MEFDTQVVELSGRQRLMAEAQQNWDLAAAGRPLAPVPPLD